MYKILDFLQDRTFDMVDFSKAFLKAGYGASLSELDYKFMKENRKRKKYQLERYRKRHLQKYIYKLKKEGFISQNEEKEFSLSVKGDERLKVLQRHKILDKNSYKKIKSNRVVIVSYDLPNLFNRERDMLRDVLRALGFKMVHKSVWVGKVKFPKSFILGLEKLKILDFIEILEVTKNGTLAEL